MPEIDGVSAEMFMLLAAGLCVWVAALLVNAFESFRK